MSQTRNTEDLCERAFASALEAAAKEGKYHGKFKSAKGRDFAQKELYDLANRVLEGKFKSQEIYDAKFDHTVAILRSQVGYVRLFTTGHSLLFVNHFMRYLYEAYREDPNLEPNFRFCHCPMTQATLNAVWNRKEILETPLGNQKAFFATILCRGSYDERYDIFQTAVQELAAQRGICALEYFEKLI